jgi:hypothetical protein
VVFGVTGIVGANGSFAVTCSDATHVTLNGAVATGTYVSGGYVSSSNEGFSAMQWVDSIQAAEGTPGGSLDEVAWMGDSFRFASSNAIRQLRITYWSSASVISSVSDSIGVDDSIDFLAVRTAGLAAASRGAKATASDLNTQALGPSQQADASGGLLRQLLAASVLREQAEWPIRNQPFRNKRSAIPFIY